MFCTFVEKFPLALWLNRMTPHLTKWLSPSPKFFVYWRESGLVVNRLQDIGTAPYTDATHNRRVNKWFNPFNALTSTINQQLNLQVAPISPTILIYHLVDSVVLRLKWEVCIWLV